jgi:hypothetical protein
VFICEFVGVAWLTRISRCEHFGLSNWMVSLGEWDWGKG